MYFGTSHPRSYISANVTGIKCVTGMSCLMRKDVLDQAGGLVAFAQYIAEDYFMAKAIADRWVSVSFRCPLWWCATTKTMSLPV